MEIARTQMWVKAGSAVIIGFGLIVAAAAWPPLSAPLLLLADLIIWPLDGLQTLDATETRVLSAIGGGVMCGWGLTLWKVAQHVVPKDITAARSIAMAGIYGWFAVDSIGSIAGGAPLNAVLNISFVLMFLWAFRGGSHNRIADSQENA